jgi:p-cumate 2,3-dioxygenase alpha subunit
MDAIASRVPRDGHWVIDDKAAGIFKVSRETFTSDEILRLERERIFDRSWLFLGHGSELAKPNDFITRRVGGRDLIFNRDRKGEYQAIINVCPHRGAMVERQPCGNAISFKCFYHGWAFNNNGRFATRSPEGVYPDDFGKDGSVDLVRVPRLESYRDFFFVNYDADARSLEDSLAKSSICSPIIHQTGWRSSPAHKSTASGPTGNCSWKTAMTAITRPKRTALTSTIC